MKLFTGSRKTSLENLRVASTDAKDERGVYISVARKKPVQSHDQKDEERDESHTKESDNDHF